MGVSATVASFYDTGKSVITATAGNFDYILEGAMLSPTGAVIIPSTAMYPGSPPVNATVTITNRGNTGIKYSVRSMNTFVAPSGETTTAGLATEILNVKITHGSTVVYDGKMSSINSIYSQDSPVIPAGSSQTVNITTTWPLSENDLKYNGASSIFILDFNVKGA